MILKIVAKKSWDRNYDAAFGTILRKVVSVLAHLQKVQI
jgi:hypothetical protein